MNEVELAVMRTMLTRRAYLKGDCFHQGDESRELYIIARGRARLRLPGNGRETRLVTFAPGTVFGEIALPTRRRVQQRSKPTKIWRVLCWITPHSTGCRTSTRVLPQECW
jgi:CRP-like cAMP-binding protein